MKTAIIIPARYGSTRFPGKPLVEIAGMTMLQRVVKRAHQAALPFDDIDIMVATEDERIMNHCTEIGARCIMTSDQCATGSDRVLEAAQNSGTDYDFLFSLQGDAPFTPPQAIEQMLDAVTKNNEIEVITPVVNLRWQELEALRLHKELTPFSGTTAVVNKDGQALWFSKNVIPAIRKEDEMKDSTEFSPVYQHLGLYGYRTDILQRFVSLPQGYYEKLEGLEQLRFLENGIKIQTVELKVDLGLAQAGIDSPEDVVRAEDMIKTHGDTA
jgi:3-deoxy-manno-octulosonate cytidylyltransferase (CMP-KDO synthetase)